MTKCFYSSPRDIRHLLAIWASLLQGVPQATPHPAVLQEAIPHQGVLQGATLLLLADLQGAIPPQPGAQDFLLQEATPHLPLEATPLQGDFPLLRQGQGSQVCRISTYPNSSFQEMYDPYLARNWLDTMALASYVILNTHCASIFQAKSYLARYLQNVVPDFILSD